MLNNIQYIDENKTLNVLIKELKTNNMIKAINITYKSNKTHLQNFEDMNLVLKRLKKLINEKLKNSKILEDVQINLYKLKNELIENKNGEVKLNISYPFKEDVIENMIKNRYKLM